MLVSCLVALAFAGAALFLSLNTTEEMVKIAAIGLAGLCVVLSLYFAPWMVKILILAIPFLLDRLSGKGILGSRQF
jgi:hypothetical protein